MQAKIMVANASTCYLFSVWLPYKLIFLLALLSNAITIISFIFKFIYKALQLKG